MIIFSVVRVIGNTATALRRILYYHDGVPACPAKVVVQSWGCH
jgi:hypothetical protein